MSAGRAAKDKIGFVYYPEYWHICPFMHASGWSVESSDGSQQDPMTN